MMHLFDSAVAAPLGLTPCNRDMRMLFRATFSRGQVGEVDIRNEQTPNLIEGDPASGWSSLVSPSVLGTRGGPPQLVALDSQAPLSKGFARVMGRVYLSNPGNTIRKGDQITIDDGTAGRRIYGLALADASGGLCECLWDGVYGFGQIMAVGGGGNDPPTAAITATPATGDKPLNVTLDASGSTDDGSITKYEFDYGEGSGWVDNGTTATIAHTYAMAGTYTASVRVTDNGSPALQAIATAQVVVTSPGGDGSIPNDGAGGGDDNSDGTSDGYGGGTVGH